MNTEIQGPPARMPQLDSLRALAFFGVAASHWVPAGGLVTMFGGTGVQLFFVLSGFLITGILLDYRQEAMSRALPPGSVLRIFYARRLLRIFPLFYAVILAAAVLNVGPIRQLWPWHAFYGSNYLYGIWPPMRGDPFTHFWSLGVEEQFYLIWPFLVLLLSFTSLQRLTLLLIVGAPVFRVVMEYAFPQFHRVNYFPFSCGDSLGVGAALALAARNGGFFGWTVDRLARVLALVGIILGIGAGLFMLKFDDSYWALTIGHTALVLVYGTLVAATAKGVKGFPGSVLNLRWLRFTGQISYGLYVFHHFFTYLDLPWLFAAIGMPVDWAANRVIGIATRLFFTFAAGIASWYLYEKPLNGLKRYFTLESARARASELPQPGTQTRPCS